MAWRREARPATQVEFLWKVIKKRDLLKRRKCGPATVRIMDTVDVFK